MKVLISGASIAGPALAFWLSRNGVDVTVAERAPSLRQGGYAVDFRGPAHLGTLARMGLLDRLKALETGGGAMRFINPRGKTTMFLPAEFAGGDLEVRRADISRVLVEATPRVDYRFGDSVTALRQSPSAVEVDFANAPTQSFDFVFGADGIHSNIRRLAYPGQQFETDLGHYVMSWDALGITATEGETICCNRPGRLLAVQPPGRDGVPASILAVLASPPLDIARNDVAAQKALIHRRFAGMGWRAPELLATLDAAPDLFFNTISRARVPRWSAGRVCLLGDAAGGTSIGGMGTGSAIVGAYVLAGELLADPAQYPAAFARYQELVEPYASASWKNGETSGRFLAPRTAMGLFARNASLNFPPLRAWMIAEAGRTGAAIDLPAYALAA